MFTLLTILKSKKLFFLIIVFQTVSYKNFIVAQDIDARNQDSIFFLKTKFKPRALIVPGLFITSGTFLNFSPLKYDIRDERNRLLLGFRTHVDDYLQYSPVVIAYSLDACGIKSKNDFWNRSAILAKGGLGMAIITTTLKYTTQIERPDYSNFHSFPSGHTAFTFALSTFLAEEYKEQLPWMPYLSYSIAGTVGVLRVANNRHFISDVLTGAGIGILSMKVAYWTHRYQWNKKKNVRKQLND